MLDETVEILSAWNHSSSAETVAHRTVLPKLTVV